MTETQRFKLPHMDEVIVGFGKHVAIALMHWTDGSDQHYAANPVKLVLYVTDAKAIADAIRAEGLRVTREPAPLKGFGDTLIGLAEDPDGYVIELLQEPAA